MSERFLSGALCPGTIQNIKYPYDNISIHPLSFSLFKEFYSGSIYVVFAQDKSSHNNITVEHFSALLRGQALLKLMTSIEDKLQCLMSCNIE